MPILNPTQNIYCIQRTELQCRIQPHTAAGSESLAALVDGNGRIIDNISCYDLELSNTFAIFSIDFGGKFRNYYGADSRILDSSDIINYAVFY